MPDRGNCVILSIWESHRAKAATNIDVMIQQKEKVYECFEIGINSRE